MTIKSKIELEDDLKNYLVNILIEFPKGKLTVREIYGNIVNIFKDCGWEHHDES